jgi:hypothetical protein
MVCRGSYRGLLSSGVVSWSLAQLISWSLVQGRAKPHVTFSPPLTRVRAAFRPPARRHPPSPESPSTGTQRLGPTAFVAPLVPVTTGRSQVERPGRRDPSAAPYQVLPIDPKSGAAVAPRGVVGD